MNENKNNLEDLLRQFVQNDQAQQMSDDIRKGDLLFESHKAPPVNSNTVCNIQRCVRSEITRSRRIHVYRQIASAAAVVALFLIGLFILNAPDKSVPKSPFEKITAADWRLNDIIRSMDESFAEIENEIGSLAETIETLDTGTYEPVSPYRLELIELEQIESITDSTEFWKG